SNHSRAMIRPATPPTINTVCQLNVMASHAATGGARIAPIELPASQRLFAVARSFGGNHTVATWSFTGKLEGSEIPRRPRKKANCPNVRDNPPPMLAVAHP